MRDRRRNVIPLQIVTDRFHGRIPWRLCLILAVVARLCFPTSAPADDAADETARLLRTFREEFVAITPGKEPFPAEFQLGRDQGPAAERPAHRVSIKPFNLARYEVPQNLWQAVMADNPSRWQGKRNSVEMVSYDDALKFCRRATELLREAKLIGPREVVRLPSEAEWEYAARAGTTTIYSFGDDAKELGDFGWFHGNAAGNDPPVGAKKPNAWKLYDLHGYLWEWCADSWHDDYTGAPRDARPWNDGGTPDKHVLRGGSWKDSPERLTSTYRQSAASDFKDDTVGFRCVLATESSE
jgi:formylglycine-generating enzyme required for sulfatase activity